MDRTHLLARQVRYQAAYEFCVDSAQSPHLTAGFLLHNAENEVHMAIAYRVGSKDDPDRGKISYTVKCKGVSAQEWSVIASAVSDEFSSRPLRVRNPFWPTFDAKTVHEFTVLMVAGGVYAGKKAIEKGADLIADVVKRKLEESGEKAKHKKTITIYGPDDQPLMVVEVKSDKKKR
jgi:hypothetical protein